ncbi:alpha/beta fold hydrolase [Streptomyces litchfieldiae]|uniref:Alpha/beta fold hydrolase n=1 Tax=Streptomyces litchfieldiae TaxID=3075543 RepID=A0ABU2MUY9_9ACTN|nr:alpha/beta fold hydrolase [Streptomyces sp. DSM 44938]MDT0344909.1 alpha/beta fold hydrolase [Streptomyces sp. DSM 44938]
MGDLTDATAVSADGTGIAFTCRGSGPAVVLVDGAMCFRDAGPSGPLAERLAADFTVFTYDRRGRGGSGDGPPYAVDREIEDLAAVIAAAGGRAHVHGISSGGLLALEALARGGAAIDRLSVFEPPLPEDGVTRQLAAQLAALVADGQRGAAVELFQTSIGIPEPMVAAMRDSPFRPVLESIAHTLVYDLTITGAAAADRYAALTTPVLVVDSTDTSAGLRSAARTLAEAIPGARHRSLPGHFHDVAPDELAPVLAEFFGA